MCAQRRGAIAVKSADPINLESLLDDVMRWYKPALAARRGRIGGMAVEAFFRAAAEDYSQRHTAPKPHLSESARHRRLLRLHAPTTRLLLFGRFEPEYRHLNPITLAIAHAIEQALAQRVEAFDFLRATNPTTIYGELTMNLSAYFACGQWLQRTSSARGRLSQFQL